MATQCSATATPRTSTGRYAPGTSQASFHAPHENNDPEATNPTAMGSHTGIRPLPGEGETNAAEASLASGHTREALDPVDVRTPDPSGAAAPFEPWT